MSQNESIISNLAIDNNTQAKYQAKDTYKIIRKVTKFPNSESIMMIR